MRKRTILLATVAAVGVVGASYGVAAAAFGDPDERVAPVRLAGVSAAPAATAATDDGSGSTSTTAGGGSSTTAVGGPSPSTTSATAPNATSVRTEDVIGLEQLTGVLQPDGSRDRDGDDWRVSGVEVDFGPDAWVRSAPVVADFDGDGTAAALLVELDGLSGREVTLGVRYEADDDGDRDDADVYTINGIVLRDPSGPAPWQTGSAAGAGAAASRADVEAAAVAAVGAGSRVADVKDEGGDDDGWRGWEIEVRDASGREYRVLVAVDGTVADVRLDD